MSCVEDPSGKRFREPPPPLPVETLLARLKDLIPRAVLGAAQQAIENLGEERIYGFALFHGQFLYAGATVFTEAGLDAKVREYEARGFATTREHLRWSPCDAPHHIYASELFAESEEVFSELDRHRDIDHSSDIGRIFLQALTDLRDSGVFSPAVLILLMEGDQSNESRFVYAERFNETGALEQFRRDLPPLKEERIQEIRDSMPTN